MANNSNPSREHTFGSSVDLLSALEALDIQYLDINDTRALVIFQTAILNLEVLDGELSSASSVELEVYEEPREDFSTESNKRRNSVIDSLLDQLATRDNNHT